MLRVIQVVLNTLTWDFRLALAGISNTFNVFPYCSDSFPGFFSFSNHVIFMSYVRTEMHMPVHMVDFKMSGFYSKLNIEMSHDNINSYYKPTLTYLLLQAETIYNM